MCQKVKFGDVVAQSWVDTVRGLTTKEATEKSLAATKVALAQRADAHVADAALGNSQYARHFEEDYDWLVNTFEMRSYLKRIDPPAGQGSWYESPEGLVYRSPDPNDDFDTRVDHVLNHTRRQSRDVDHGVFTTPSPFETVDEAFRVGGLNQDVQLVDPNLSADGVGYTVPANETNLAQEFDPVFCVRVGGTVDQIRTAFPKSC